MSQEPRSATRGLWAKRTWDAQPTPSSDGPPPTPTLRLAGTAKL